MKTLTKKQKQIKLDRDKLRQQYLDYLKSKGKDKKDSSGSRGGYSSSGSDIHTSSSVVECISESQLPLSEGSAWTVNETLGAAVYLKPTQSGFDEFLSIRVFPWGDWSGTNEIYNQLLWFEVRHTTNNVTDSASFNTAWDAASTYYSVGSDSNTTTAYSVPSYWHFTPTLTSGYNYRMLFKIKLANASLTYATTISSRTTATNLTILSNPSVSFSQTTNGFTISGATSGTYRAIEFNRNSYTPYSSYLTSEETDICYNCAVRNQEFGIYSGQVRQAFNFALWDVGTYTVKLSYATAHPSGTRTRFSNAVNAWISEMNSTISGSGISFVRDDYDASPDILINTLSNAGMGAPSGSVYAGLWYNETNAAGFIDYAWIRLNYETAYYDGIWSSVETVTYEELTQSAGCGGWKIFIIKI